MLVPSDLPIQTTRLECGLSYKISPSGQKGALGTQSPIFWSYYLAELMFLYRLKMNFVNVGTNNGTSLNTGSAPVLASTFSDVFQVFSAKKFPGVIESTSLSKCFATQGIKIPIRKDGPKALSNREEYENDD